MFRKKINYLFPSKKVKYTCVVLMRFELMFVTFVTYKLSFIEDIT